jgi:uncharacterized protein
VSRPALADVSDLDAFRPGTREREAVNPEPSVAAANTMPSRERSIVEELRPSLAAVSPATPDKPAATVAETPKPALTVTETAKPARGHSALEALLEVPAPAAKPEAVASSALDDTGMDLESPLLSFQDLLDDELSQELTRPAAAPMQPTIPSIISDKAGRQVAAAFGELSEAFAATRQKSFDEMAEAMIRPMLSEWLDNNLPTLVERLVREEIERIARGPAR